jgi:hypothetical protein
MRTRLLAGVIAVNLAGCALATTRGPEDTSGKTRPTCSTSTRATKIDIAAGTVGGIGGIVSGLFIADSSEAAGYSVLIGGIAAIVGFYTSAAIGVVRTRRCEDAIGEYNFRSPSTPIPTDADADATDN